MADDNDAAVVSLLRWAGTARTEDAADARQRERWLRQQAEETATLAGIVDAAVEQHADVVARMLAGGSHAGTAVAAGADFVALVRARALTLVRLEHLAALVLRDHTAPASFDRRGERHGSFATVLAGLAAERETVTLYAGSETLNGELRAVGDDVVTLRLASAAADVIYVPVASLSGVSVRVSG